MGMTRRRPRWPPRCNAEDLVTQAAVENGVWRRLDPRQPRYDWRRGIHDGHEAVENDRDRRQIHRGINEGRRRRRGVLNLALSVTVVPGTLAGFPAGFMT